MVLQMVSTNEALLEEIAEYLLAEKLLYNVMLREVFDYRTGDGNGGIVTTQRYGLKGISKSLLFGRINELLRKKYKDKMPLLYSEPIILIDPEQTDVIAESLVKI